MKEDKDVKCHACRMPKKGYDFVSSGQVFNVKLCEDCIVKFLEDLPRQVANRICQEVGE